MISILAAFIESIEQFKYRGFKYDLIYSRIYKINTNAL